MRQAAAIARVSARQLLWVRRTWGLLALAGVPLLVMALGGAGKTEPAAFEFFHQGPLFALLVIVTPIVALLNAAAALGAERSQHTLSFLAVRPLRRWQIALAKFGAAWAAGFAVAGAGAVALVPTLVVYAGEAGTAFPLLLAVLLNVAVYAALFVPLGLLMRRAVLGGLIFVLVWEMFLSIVIGPLATFSVSRIGLSAYAGLVPESLAHLGDALGAVTPGAGGAVAKTVVIALLGVAATAAVLRRRDLA